MENKTKLPHPHECIAELVNSWDRIRPYLKEGRTNEIGFFILETAIRGQMYENTVNMLRSNKGTYGKWRWALQELSGLASAIEEQGDALHKKIPAQTLLHVDRYVEDLDLMLKNDSNYKQFRN